MALNEDTLKKFVDSLSVLELKRVEEVVKAKLEAMRYAAFRFGSIVSFKDRAGNIHHMKVTRINAKSVSGTEIGTSRTWRVHPSLLTPAEDFRPAAPATKPKPVPHTPVTAGSGGW